MLTLTDRKDWFLAEIRVFHPLEGGILAVISYYLWPLWQRRYLPQQLVIVLQTSLSYFQTVGAAYQGQAQNPKTLDIIRRQAELAGSSALITATHISQEPKQFQNNVEAMMTLIINVNSFVNGITTLRQHYKQFQPSGTLPGLDLFIQQVTDTLKNLQ
ncbi:hypothetical protein [Gloeothece verrucosa]|uniref:hypothetical protein n=1 Tax=Gloeothece verrucosa TaxID=2546359 RepID=UPI00030711A9|nr:hypothetical protein [Gloeothece verrucosa]